MLGNEVAHIRCGDRGGSDGTVSYDGAGRDSDPPGEVAPACTEPREGRRSRRDRLRSRSKRNAERSEQFPNLEPRVAMRASDRFRVASITKTFVATIVLQLEAEGKLDIDDPVERWLPGRVPSGASIMLRELLSHTSGIFNYTDDQAFIDGIIANPSRAWLPAEPLSVAFSHAALFAPGTNWSYSNTNFILLAHVIEAVTGTPIEQQFQQRIFGPLHLRRDVVSRRRLRRRTLRARLPRRNAGVPRRSVGPPGHHIAAQPSWAWAAGGMVPTAADVHDVLRRAAQGAATAGRSAR